MSLCDIITPTTHIVFQYCTFYVPNTSVQLTEKMFSNPLCHHPHPHHHRHHLHGSCVKLGGANRRRLSFNLSADCAAAFHTSCAVQKSICAVYVQYLYSIFLYLLYSIDGRARELCLKQRDNPMSLRTPGSMTSPAALEQDTISHLMLCPLLLIYASSTSYSHKYPQHLEYTTPQCDNAIILTYPANKNNFHQLKKKLN